MQYLKRGVMNSFFVVRKKKSLFLLLTVMQLLFLFSLIFTLIYYQVQIFKNIQGITQPIQEANYDTASLEEGKPFLTNIAAIAEQYNLLLRNVFSLIAVLLLLFLIGNGFLWSLSHKILQNLPWKKMVILWKDFIIASLVISIPIGLIYFLILKNLIAQQVNPDSFVQVFKYLLYSLIIVYYILIVLFSSITSASWKTILEKVYKIGIKNIHYAILPLLISAGILFGVIYLLYLSLELQYHIIIPLLLIVLFIALMAFSRLFIISSLQYVTHEKNYH